MTTRNILFCALMLSVSLIGVGQDVSHSNLMGQWSYNTSMDSTNLGWNSYAAQDHLYLEQMEAVGETTEAQPSTEEGEQMDMALDPMAGAMYGGMPGEGGVSIGFHLDLPLLLKDHLYTMRILPITSEDSIWRVNFLEYPAPSENSKYTYKDRTIGYLRIKLETKDNQPYIVFFTDEKSEEYILLSLTKSEMILWDKENNLKHSFNRKL